MSVYVIAEAGVNHNGDLSTAVDLIAAAKAAGADCVKFQLFSAKRLGQPELEPLELSPRQMQVLKGFAEAARIDFLCTAFSFTDADELAGMGCASVKLSSRDALMVGLIEHCSENFSTVYLSTGNPYGEPHPPSKFWWLPKNVLPLHCVSKYPANPAEANLMRMWDLETEPFGYSDHTRGIVAPITAVALGATVIEKHLTLDRSQPGPDHHMSMDPLQFIEMVKALREAEVML